MMKMDFEKETREIAESFELPFTDEFIEGKISGALRRAFLAGQESAVIYLTEQKERLIPSERDRPDVQISEDMILAGLVELFSRDPEQVGSDRETVVRVYRAMELVAQNSQAKP